MGAGRTAGKSPKSALGATACGFATGFATDGAEKSPKSKPPPGAAPFVVAGAEGLAVAANAPNASCDADFGAGLAAALERAAKSPKSKSLCPLALGAVLEFGVATGSVATDALGGAGDAKSPKSSLTAGGFATTGDGDEESVEDGEGESEAEGRGAD